jgi:hypothetical protein
MVGSVSVRCRVKCLELIRAASRNVCYVRLSERTKADEHRAFAEGLRRNAS